MIAIIAAVTAAVVLAAMAAMQILVAMGRPYGAFVFGGQHRVLPRHLRIVSAIAVPLYLAFATVLWSRAGIPPAKTPPPSGSSPGFFSPTSPLA